MLIFFTSYYQA
nr:unnamed protein product [Callosobruchus analis]